MQYLPCDYEAQRRHKLDQVCERVSGVFATVVLIRLGAPVADDWFKSSALWTMARMKERSRDQR
jgi:hypothetical protein